MSLRSFYYFLVTAEEMHFSRAAKRLYITQQSLSNHIQKLEQQYEVQLFERRPSLKLTLAGERMVTHVKRILETEALMNAEFADIYEHKRGKLVVGISRSRAQVFMPEIWDQYRRIYPNIDISLVEDMTVNLEKMLQDGKIDMYIGVNAPQNTNTNQLVLSRENFYCIFTKQLLQEKLAKNWKTFRATYREGIDLMAIKDFPFIMLPKKNQLRVAVDQYFSVNGITPRVTFETSDHELLFEMSRRGAGVGIISQMFLYQPLLKKEFGDNLVALPIKSSLPVNNSNLVYRSEQVHVQYFEAFIETVQQVIDSHMSEIDKMLLARS